jgi:hypothetical protein
MLGGRCLSPFEQGVQLGALLAKSKEPVLDLLELLAKFHR